MASLDTTTTVVKDAAGNDIATTVENFPASHMVYVEMGKNAKKMKNDQGKLISHGIFSFQNPMNSSEEGMIVDIFDAPYLTTTVAILQIQFKEATEATFSSPVNRRAGGRLGTSSTATATATASGALIEHRKRNSTSSSPSPTKKSKIGK